MDRTSLVVPDLGKDALRALSKSNRRMGAEQYIPHRTG